jgi:hypothetical protein
MVEGERVIGGRSQGPRVRRQEEEGDEMAVQNIKD